MLFGPLGSLRLPSRLVEVLGPTDGSEFQASEREEVKHSK